MIFFILGVTAIVSLIVSIFSYKFLLHKRTFQILTKKNTDSERWASQTKPIFGGFVFYISFILAYIVAIILLDFRDIETQYICVLLLTVSLSFFIGLFDDLQNQGPFKKFIVQLFCASALIYCNVYITTSDNNIINYTLTFLWVIGIMNSINMLDNMDAISGSVSTIILIAIAGIIYMTHQNMLDLVILTSLIPALLVYLYWNWYPSKMYMGDNGSQFLGIILAIFSIQYIWNAPESIVGVNYESFILVGLAFLLPITDTTIVFINRLAKGKSPFIGDKYHTTHNLVYMGLSERNVARVFIILTLISNSIVFYIISFTNIAIHTNYYIIALIFIAMISTSFYIISRIAQTKNKIN